MVSDSEDIQGRRVKTVKSVAGLEDKADKQGSRQTSTKNTKTKRFFQKSFSELVTRNITAKEQQQTSEVWKEEPELYTAGA